MWPGNCDCNFGMNGWCNQWDNCDRFVGRNYYTLSECESLNILMECNTCNLIIGTQCNPCIIPMYFQYVNCNGVPQLVLQSNDPNFSCPCTFDQTSIGVQMTDCCCGIYRVLFIYGTASFSSPIENCGCITTTIYVTPMSMVGRGFVMN